MCMGFSCSWGWLSFRGSADKVSELGQRLWLCICWVSGSSQAWLACSSIRGLNRCLHQSKVNQLPGLGSLLGGLWPPGGQCRGWSQRQQVNCQGEATEVRKRPGAGVGVGSPRGGDIGGGKGCSHKAPGKQASTVCPGLGATRSARSPG